MKVVIGCLLIFALQCTAQRLTVYSPLTRFDPFGEIVPADRGTRQPRDILSPGVPRNASTGVRLVAELAQPEAYEIEVGLNPDDVVGLTLYRELFTKVGDSWYPDELVRVPLPYRGTAADFAIPGQTAVSFWLDMKVPRDAPVDRIKVQPQLWSASIDTWVLYPMEVRIQEPVATRQDIAFAELPSVDARADLFARGALDAALCGKKETATPPPAQLRVGHLLHREGAALLALIPEHLSKSIRADWCATQDTLPSVGPEWFLRFRDRVYRAAGAID